MVKKKKIQKIEKEKFKKREKIKKEKMKRMKNRALGLKDFWTKLVSWVLALFLVLRNVQKGAAIDT